MKFVDLSALPLTWTQIGTLPSIMTYGGSNFNPFTCMVNGYFSIFFPCSAGGNPAISKGAVLFSFDGKGGMCTYQTSDYSPSGTQDGICRAFQIWQSNNTFIYALLGGGTWKFTVPNVFTAGATYTVNPQSFSTPSPCNQGTYNQTIFCGSQGIYANEFIEAFPLSDNYWASIYDQYGAFLGGGFIGNSASDLFDQRDLSLPPQVSTSNIYDRNGLTVYGNFGHSTAVNQVVGTGLNFLNGDASTLMCGVQNQNVFVSTKNPLQIYYNRDYNIAPFNSGPDSVIEGVTDIPKTILYPDSSGPKLLSGDFFVALPNKVGNWPTGYISKTKQLFAAAMNFNWNQSYPVYVASLDLSPYGPLPVANRSDFSGLANYHRVISPTGQYQA